MKSSRGPLAAVLLTVITAIVLAACGSSSSSSSAAPSSGSSRCGTSGGKSRRHDHPREGTAPDSLDPAFGYTTQAAEPDWLAYTGLITYAHANGHGRRPS